MEYYVLVKSDLKCELIFRVYDKIGISITILKAKGIEVGKCIFA